MLKLGYLNQVSLVSVSAKFQLPSFLEVAEKFVLGGGWGGSLVTTSVSKLNPGYTCLIMVGF